MSTATASPATPKPTVKPSPLESVHADIDALLESLSRWPHEQVPILAKRVHEIKNRVNAAAVGVPIRDPKAEL